VRASTASLDWKTPLGWIRIRGTRTDNIDATDSLLIVDLGGDDRWSGPAGASSPTRLLGLALDLSGNDIYEGQGATQGAGITGIGILLDAAGNDRYSAQYYAQGIGQFGLGALIDLGGNDIYSAGHSAQGAAFFCGIGILADAAGDDQYEIVASGQGFGGPGSVGFLADRMGSDIYRAEPDARKSGRPSYATQSSASSAQGVGIGWNAGRAKGHSWAGGLGALIDIEGDDRYIAGDWSEGTGYWFGTGLLYDGNGNDHYEGGLRWSQATAAHFAIGVLLDEGGDDVNLVHGAGLGLAHDVSVALFVATGGNDHYTISEGGLGYSRDRSPLGLFIDIGGNDVYEGKSGEHPGFAQYNPAFARDADGTGNVSEIGNRGFPALAYMSSVGLFLDVGGTDTYWGGVANDAVWGDEPGSDNWKVRNPGVGMDVAQGSIDWRPLARSQE
jgi:hypothetical protein